jgi:hypothetical protein
MKTMARAKLCLFLYAFCTRAGVISGTVVEASSGDAVRKAVVTVTWQGTPHAWATTRTDGSGRFIFEGLPAGKYTLAANKPGLGVANYGADSVRELGDAITLGDGETLANLKLRFVRSGSISGRVVDPDGEPVSGAGMNLLRAGRSLGEHVLLNYRGASTNDRGEYKITGVDPGEYYLRCIPNGMQRRMGLFHPEMVVPQYFGGARDSKDAAALHLRSGDSLSGIDFHLTAGQAATITGRVTGVPQLDPAGSELITDGPIAGRRMRRGGDQTVNVMLTAADADQMWFGNSGAGAQAPDFGFEMLDNVPGRYRIQASVTAKEKRYYASQIIDAHEGTNEIVLAMVPAVEVKGHLKVEGPAAHPVESFTVMLSSGPPHGEGFSSPVEKDGSFAIKEVPPGEWILNVNSNGAGMFEKLVRLGDKDYLFKKIEVPPGLDAPLNVVLSSNAATVEGEVDAGGADAKRAGILLEPVGKWHTLTRFYYSTVADDGGKFKVTGVAPGKYKIFALEKIVPASYQNPEAGDVLDALGEELEVAEGANVRSHPKLIPQEKAKELLKP